MVAIGIAMLLIGASPYSVWHQVYDGGREDMGHGVCLDSADHVLVVGETNQASDYDCWMIVVSKSGDSLRSRLYDDGGDEKGFAVTTTRDGALGIAALIDENMVGTILYDEDGGLLWERQNRGEEIAGILATPEQKVFTACWYIQLERYYATVYGHNHQGDAVYFASQRVLDGDVTDIATDSLEYVYLGDGKSSDCSLWKFSPDGELEWRKFYGNNAARGFGLAINDAGYLFQAGDIAVGSTIDFLLLKWNTSGRLFWDPGKNYDLGADEYCRDIKLDAISDCYLAGYQVRGSERDAALVKTDSAGNMLWGWVDTLEGNQEIEGIEVDADGYVYLAGSHYNGSNWDMLVMKVRQPLTITGRVTDSTGAPMEGITVSLTGDTMVEAVTDTGGYYLIEVYNGGEYTVSPNLSNWTFEPSSRSYSPLAYREMDQDFENGRRSGTAEESMESPAYWKLISSVGPQVVLEYSNCLRGFNVSIFDPLGCKVDEIHAADPSGSLTWGQGVSPGVYFIRADSNPPPSVQKAVLIR